MEVAKPITVDNGSLTERNTRRALTRKNAVWISVAFNTLVWIYFWVAFAAAAVPFEPHPEGADVPYSPVTVFGHSIGLTGPLTAYPFFRVVGSIQLPTMAVLGGVRGLVAPKLTRDAGLIGTDLGGFFMLSTMVLSYVQWYLVGRTIVWVREALRKH
jgi:hypothetical protein